MARSRHPPGSPRAELAEALQALAQLGAQGKLTSSERHSIRMPSAAAEARTAAEAVAANAQVRFQTLVEQIPAITFSASFASGLKELYVSPQIEDIMGYKQQEWLDSPVLWYERLHPEDKARWNHEFGETVARGVNFKAVYRFLSKDGRVVWLHGEARIIRDAQNRPLWLQGVGFDVTDVYEAQARIQAAEQKAKQRLEEQVRERTRVLQAYRHLVDSSLDAIASLHQDGTLEAWNARAATLLGLTPDLRGKARFESFFSDDPLACERLAGAIAGGRACAVETTGTSQNGYRQDLSISLFPVLDDEQQLRGMSAIIRDETENRRAGHRFELAVEAAPNAMIMVDGAGRISLVNSEAERLFGYTRTELLGQPIEVLVPEQLRARHPELRAEFAMHPRSRAMGQGRDLRGRRKDGDEFPVEIGLNPIETADGMFVLCAVVDISERKRAEQTIFETNLALRAKTAQMEQFVYTVSHDLKSPLITINSFIELLREDLASGNAAAADDVMQRIRKAVQRMHALLNDLLELSRTGSVEMQPARVDLDQVLSDVLDATREQLSEVGMEVLRPGPLPVVVGDRDRLYQVLENLIANAARHATTADSPRVMVTTEQRGDELRVRFSDNGPGIPRQHRERIFDLFQRLSPETEGTGVGLAIVARVMEMHGGRVWVENAEGGGACFVLTLPQTSK